MKIPSVRWPLSALAFALLVGAAGTAEAQAADAAQYVGKWTLAFAPPAGGGGFAGAARGGGGGGGGPRGTPTLEVRQDGDKLAAEMSGMMGGGQTISDVTVSATGMVLKYTLSFQGQSVPVTLRLTPDGEAMTAEMDLGGMMTRTGTATRAQ